MKLILVSNDGEVIDQTDEFSAATLRDCFESPLAAQWLIEDTCSRARLERFLQEEEAQQL